MKGRRNMDGMYQGQLAAGKQAGKGRPGAAFVLVTEDIK